MEDSDDMDDSDDESWDDTVEDLDLSGLTTAEGLNLPETVEYLYIDGLTTADKEKLRERYPQHADKIW